MSEKKETKTEAAAEDKFIHAGQEVGKAIARSTFKAEQTGKKIKKTVSRLGNSKGKEETKKIKSPFTDKSEFALIDNMGFVAGEIFEHLSQHGELASEKLVKTIMGRKNSKPMVFCAIGWLAREGKINLSADGAVISLKPE